MQSTRLVILDRDGVINEDSDEYIKSPAEWHPIPGSLEAIARLHRAGYTVVIATNQSGVARGYFTLEALARIHDTLRAAVAAAGGRIDGIFFCPHHPDARCACRKPQPGLLREIAEVHHVDLKSAWLIGDALRDIEAARAVGCRAMLVKTGYGARACAEHAAALQDIPVFHDLAAAVAALIGAR